MADLLLFGRLADASRARPRRFRCFNAHCYFWFARKASRELKLKLTYYFSSIVAQLLKLSTICKSPLHGPHNYVDHTWERSANYSARTDQGLKQFFCEFPNNISLLQNNKPIQSATIDLTLHCFWYGLPSPCLHRYRKISS